MGTVHWRVGRLVNGTIGIEVQQFDGHARLASVRICNGPTSTEIELTLEQLVRLESFLGEAQALLTTRPRYAPPAPFEDLPTPIRELVTSTGRPRGHHLRFATEEGVLVHVYASCNEGVFRITDIDIVPEGTGTLARLPDVIERDFPRHNVATIEFACLTNMRFGEFLERCGYERVSAQCARRVLAPSTPDS